MNILSYFDFRNKFKSIFTRDNINKLKNKIKEEIIYYVRNKDLLGPQKKELVVGAIQKYISITFVSSNFIVSFFIKILIANTSTIVQIIYELLKDYIDGLTLSET